eukprot:CFRG1285T1
MLLARSTTIRLGRCNGRRKSVIKLNAATFASTVPARNDSHVGRGADISRTRNGIDGNKLLISQLLQLFKQTSDTRQYLKYYGSAGQDRFAIIRVSGDVLHNKDHLFQTAASLSFLHRVGLRPIVVHGAGIFSGRRNDVLSSLVNSAEDRNQSEAHASSENVNIKDEESDKKVCEAAIDYMCRANSALVETLSVEFGIGAAPLVDTVFRAHSSTDYDGPKSWSALAGKISAVNKTIIESAFRQGLIPIVSSLGWGIDCHRLLSFSTNEATCALATAFSPLKIIMLRPEGCLRSQHGDRFKHINLSRDFAALQSQQPTENGVRLLQCDYKDFIDAAHTFESIEAGATLAVTSPALLSQELFTHQGAGTLMVRGERIDRVTDLDSRQVDLDLMKKILETSFNSKLPDTYFASIRHNFRSMYVPACGRGVAIVLTINGLPYLDKIAVLPSSQGDQLGDQIWQAMMIQERSLFWRSKTSNAVNPWYYERSHGAFKDQQSPWTVFWYNVTKDQVMPCIEEAVRIKATFE